jgi:hypothetical protein
MEKTLPGCSAQESLTLEASNREISTSGRGVVSPGLAAGVSEGGHGAGSVAAEPGKAIKNTSAIIRKNEELISGSYLQWNKVPQPARFLRLSAR